MGLVWFEESGVVSRSRLLFPSADLIIYQLRPRTQSGKTFTHHGDFAQTILSQLLLMALIIISIAAMIGVTTSVRIFASPDSLPSTIPSDCRSALSANITCPAIIKANQLLSMSTVNETFLEQYCDCMCTDSLTVSGLRKLFSALLKTPR